MRSAHTASTFGEFSQVALGPGSGINILANTGSIVTHTAEDPCPRKKGQSPSGRSRAGLERESGHSGRADLCLGWHLREPLTQPAISHQQYYPTSRSTCSLVLMIQIWLVGVCAGATDEG